MSQADAPNFRKVTPEKCCLTCLYGNLYFYIKCSKFAFTIEFIPPGEMVCDLWAGEGDE